MITGFNTNVEYRDKVFHVQTEDCERRSLIRTVVFDEGQVVAAIDSPYADLTGSDSPHDQELSRRLKVQHWKLVKRLQESGPHLEMDETIQVPIVDPAVQHELAKLDQRIERLRTLRERFASDEETRSELPLAVAEPTRRRRGFNPLLALGAVVLVAAGWTIRSFVDGASGPSVAIVDSPPRIVANARVEPEPVTEPAAEPAADPVDLPKPVAVEEVATVSKQPSQPTREIRVVAPPRAKPVTPPPAEPPAETIDATLVSSPRIEHAELPTEPTPELVSQPLTQPVDWTGKLVPLADVDTPPWPIQRDLPSYTRRAKRRKQEGSVGLNLLVNENGIVAQIVLVETIPDSDLNDAAVEIARLWQFRPARKAGYPVRVWKPLTVDFSIVSGMTRVVVRGG